nr:type II secretion system minor pseudopilin GspJ [Grimontia hollisae]
MYRQSKGKGTNQGFTLIEVLLALMIFATLSVAANQIFRNVINSNVQTEEVGNALKSLQRTLLIMDSDFRQMLARQYRNGSDEAKEALLEFGDDLLDSESQGIRFVRGGWINPQQLFPRGKW